MINSKISDILEKFTENEFKEFGKYVNSPYFNANKKLIAAYNYFKKYYKNFGSENFAKEMLYSEVFPGVKYRDTEARKLLSGLTKLAEGFMSQRIYDTNEFEKNINAAGALISKGIIKPAEKMVETLERGLINEKISGHHHFDSLLKIQIKKKSIELKKDTFQTKDFAEDKIDNYLLCYFISFAAKIVQNIKAKQYYNLMPPKTGITEFFTITDIEKFINWLSEEKNKFSEILIMYLCIIKCVNNSYDKDTYYKFKKLLLNNYSLFTYSELINLFTCLQGIQIRRYRENDPEALPEIFDVNNLILKHKAYSYYPGGDMHYGTFVTMVTIGIGYEKFEWTKNFIDKYTPLLNEKHRQSLYNYAMAELTYKTAAPGKALFYTSKIEYEGFFMKQEVNILKLKIFYDENDFIAIQYQLDTYKKLIEGNKYIGKFQYDIYSNFVKIYSELVRIKESKNNTGVEILQKKIENSTYLLGKDWLLQKAKELNKI